MILVFATHSVHIYLKWLAAKQPAELHMYEKGKHGFGTKKQDLPVDSWMDRFFDWLQKQELTKKYLIENSFKQTVHDRGYGEGHYFYHPVLPF